MAKYTFRIETPDVAGAQIEVHEFPDDVAANDAAGDHLDKGHESIAVARGVGEEVAWLGAWDWCEGQPRWTAEE